MIPYAKDLRSRSFASMNPQADKGPVFFRIFDTPIVGIRRSVDAKTKRLVCVASIIHSVAAVIRSEERRWDLRAWHGVLERSTQRATLRQGG
jgi:hypothetical protein